MGTIANKRLLELALAGLEVERQRIDDEISDLTSQLQGPAPVPSQAGPKKKRHLTAAGRKKISEMMKKRWAEKRNAAKPGKRKTR